MNIDGKMKQSTLARILKAKAITDKDEWLKHHLDSYQFGGQEAYEHFKGEHVYIIKSFELPEHLVCIKTDNCLISKQVPSVTGFEIAILDTQRHIVVYYLLCLPTDIDNTVCPVSWRIASAEYAGVLHNVDVVILGQVLKQSSLCIGSNALIAGNSDYWCGIIRYFYKHNFKVCSIPSSDKINRIENLSSCNFMRRSDMKTYFIEIIFLDNRYRFIIIQGKD
ncbi:hypothetical protein FNZ18_16260 [Salmonella enterica subsp. salamae]|nr:hypothetical protein [Salmonella enterica subsp. salamae]